MRRDRYMDRLDFGGGAEYPSSGAQRERKQKATLISVANSEAYNGYRKTISDGGNFSLPEGSEWPLAQFETSAGLVRVQLRPEMNEPLIPEELSEIARNMFERAKTFSDVEADVCDILMQNWLKDAKDAKHRAEIETDDLCRGRGLKAKLSGNGRRGGYTPQQRRQHLNAASSIFESWIIAREAPVFEKGKSARGRLLLESRHFVVTDRVGEQRFSWTDSACHDNCIDVLAFKYVVAAGNHDELVGAVLPLVLQPVSGIGARQRAEVSSRAIKPMSVFGSSPIPARASIC